MFSTITRSPMVLFMSSDFFILLKYYVIMGKERGDRRRSRNWLIEMVEYVKECQKCLFQKEVEKVSSKHSI